MITNHIQILLNHWAVLLAKKHQLDQQINEIEQSIKIITYISQQQLTSHSLNPFNITTTLPGTSPRQNKPKNQELPFNPPRMPKDLCQNNIADWVQELQKWN